MNHEEILSHFPGKRIPNGQGGVLVPCPLGHGMKTPCLSITPANGAGPRFHCFTCNSDRKEIIEAAGLTLADIYDAPRRKPSPAAASRTSAPITVSDLGKDKRLPVDFLQTLGLEDRRDFRTKKGRTFAGVLIPYRMMDESPAPRQRARTALSAKDGSEWLPGDGSPVPYGLDRLMDAREHGFLVLVEGESDCWTLWLHGFPALGIPGATMGKTLQAEYLLGIGEIYLWREPDGGGETFAEKIPARLREIGYTGGIFEAKLDGMKDPNELHKKNPKDFKATFQAALDAARTAAPAMATEAATAEGLEDFRATELWTARLFVHLHGDKVRYSDRLGGWHYYDGKRWARGETGEIERLAKEIPRAMYRMAAEEGDEGRRQAIAKHAARTEAAGKLAAILELAKTEEGIAVPPEAFDAQPWKFNTATGTLELINGELLPHRPGDMLTNLSPAEWRGLDAKAERFKQFLHEAMDGDQEKIDFLQRAAGYTLSADMREQVFLFAHGPEAAGKGTFIRALADVMGTYARSTEISTFLTARRDSVRNDVASLVGSRLVTASEPEDGQVFDEGLIKILTGQDRTTARFLFRESFEFSATFKLWLQGNHRPHIKSTGGAMWRRLLIVPFMKTVPEDQRDKTLGDRLKSPEERAGILAWMVRGCLEWQRAGLRPPDSVRAAVAEYRAAEDRLAPFLEECTGASEHGEVPAGQLYAKYKAWADVNGERPISNRTFGLRLEEKGYTPTRTKRSRAWKGLFLVEREEAR